MARVLRTLWRFSCAKGEIDENSTLEIRRTYVARNALRESYTEETRPRRPHPSTPIFRPSCAGPPSRAELLRSSVVVL